VAYSRRDANGAQGAERGGRPIVGRCQGEKLACAIERLERSVRIIPIRWVQRILWVVLVRGVERIVGAVLIRWVNGITRIIAVRRVEDVVVALILLVEARVGKHQLDGSALKCPELP